MTQIFIDESGLFKDAPAGKSPWSVVGALAVAEQRLEQLKLVVEGLPTYLELAQGEEPKGTCFKSDKQLIHFVEQLKDCDLVFVPGVVFLDEVQAPLFQQFAGIDSKLPETGKRIASSKTLQNYIQSNVLLDLLNSALWASILHFSQTDPCSLRAFKWVLDEKEVVENFVRPKLIDYSSGLGNNVTHSIISSNRMNLGPFYEGNGRVDRSGFYPKKIFQDFHFKDSKSHSGLLAVDILSNAFRRCLRGNWDDADAVATAISRLMVDQKHLKVVPRDASLPFNSTILPISDKFKKLTGARHPIIDRLVRCIPVR